MDITNRLGQNTAIRESRMTYHWEWPIGLGILLIIFGVVALAAPVATSVALAWLLGALFLASGIPQLIHAFRFRKEKGAVSRFLLATLSIVAGVVTMRNPLAGTLGLTLILAFYLLTGAVGKWLLAFDMKPAKGWGLLFLSALISFGLGVFLIATFPVTSLVVPGLFLGVDLIFYGSALISIAFILRKAAKQGIDELEDRRVA